MMRGAKKSKTKRNLLLVLTVIVAIIVIMTSAIRHHSQKPSASDYLKVEHIGSLGEFYNNNKTVNIKELGLRITAVGGDATNILITGLSTPGEEYPLIDFLRKGESKEITVQLRSYITSLNETIGLFPVELTIGCLEASPSDIIIFLKPEDIKGPHY
jgi:hypothetical protein